MIIMDWLFVNYAGSNPFGAIRIVLRWLCWCCNIQCVFLIHIVSVHCIFLQQVTYLKTRLIQLMLNLLLYFTLKNQNTVCLAVLYITLRQQNTFCFCFFFFILWFLLIVSLTLSLSLIPREPFSLYGSHIHHHII